MHTNLPRLFLVIGLVYVSACATGDNRESSSDYQYDVVIRNGTLYDGSGETPFQADIAITADSIASIGNLKQATAHTEIDATGLAVSPGFINMLSWANESLIRDGRSQSDIRQGVTLEVFGEGWSMGPLSDALKKERAPGEDTPWTTLGGYLTFLEAKGVSPNIASFVGATTIRIHELGYENRPPDSIELERMRELVRLAMREGALGVGTSLIYAPAFYASTEELIELAKAAADYDGMYISHIRDEGNQFLEALDEFLQIAREADIRAEVYHFKAKGELNWPKLEQAIARIESARGEGLGITANMYTYHASSTGLNATMPPWVQEGGLGAWRERLRNPEVRERLRLEMTSPAVGWTNNLELAGSADNVLLVGFRSDSLKRLTGSTLAEVAQARGTSPEDTAMDLVIEDSSRVSAVYFVMNEDNIRRKLALPWMSFGSDGSSLTAKGDVLSSQTHPRAYGNFARVLGNYVREDKVISLEEAIRRMTSFPASNLKIQRRGRLAVGYFADVVLFDPERIQDHATFDNPHQYATGVVHVFVNGEQVLQDGEHTGALPGRVVRGPGWVGWKD